MIYGLYLNKMNARCKEQTLVACARTEQELHDYLDRQRAPKPYMDGQWAKTFKLGSPLEWFNPLEDVCSTGIVPLPTCEQYIQRAAEIWDAEIGSKFSLIEAQP